MPPTSIDQLPRREREVFETLYRLEQATAATLRGVLADPLSDSAVRTLLSRLEVKGLVRRTAGPDGFVYAPVPRTDAVAESALKRMVETFFAGSAASAATALLGLGQTLTPDEAEALRRTIDRMGTSGEGEDRS
ncbi:MAG: BlaI/MecI/CopY family transcriptional regulator [Brevundimonas sp.]|uniref:BlaI/MecI/CopY family transcriptional regulator n=1 Tax=Brevundimonas sp. TaxID=1871086 RepID=UPI002734E3C7|nr:BlaI/MecI/CopY family transcriptional regulator [Brevundimonas sp.]MDP3377899.1 BlaI/MecI/CopY family transcriptional regulator [Brevundimonas sp.]